MKKLIVLALSVLLIVAFSSIFVSAEEVNVAKGKSYTYTGAYTDSAGKVNYPDIDNKQLTDGVVAKVAGDVAYAAELWVGMNQGGEGVIPNSGIVEIVLDLGSSVSGINKFTMNVLHQGGPGISSPKDVKISVSDDNKTFKDVGKMTITKTLAVPGTDERDKENGIYDCTLSSANQTARYIKYTINLGGAWVFVSEIGAYTGGEPATSTPTESSASSEPASSEPATSSDATGSASSAASSTTASNNTSSNAASSAAPSEAASSEDGGLSTGAIVGIAVGAVVVIGVVVYFVIAGKKKK